MSRHRFGLVSLRKARFFAPLLTFLLGMAVPVTLSAAFAEKPTPGTYARIGVDERFPNALACHHDGEFLLLTYEKSEAPIRYGFVTLSGTVKATPLREAVRNLSKPGTHESKAPEASGTPDANPDAPKTAGSKPKPGH